MKRACVLVCAAALAACSNSVGPQGVSAESAPAKPTLGIRPNGDTEIQPDLALVKSDELKKIYNYIDEHIDDCLLYTSDAADEL